MSTQPQASSELTDLVARYNEQHGTVVNPSLNDIIYMVVRLGESIKQDPRFTGGWDALVRETRRRLYSKLSMTDVVKGEVAEKSSNASEDT